MGRRKATAYFSSMVFVSLCSFVISCSHHSERCKMLESINNSADSIKHYYSLYEVAELETRRLRERGDSALNEYISSEKQLDRVSNQLKLYTKIYDSLRLELKRLTTAEAR